MYELILTRRRQQTPLLSHHIYVPSFLSLNYISHVTRCPTHGSLPTQPRLQPSTHNTTCTTRDHLLAGVHLHLYKSNSPPKRPEVHTILHPRSPWRNGSALDFYRLKTNNLTGHPKAAGSSPAGDAFFFCPRTFHSHLYHHCTVD